MAAPLAAGYHGPAELTVGRAFTAWTFDPWMCVIVLLLGAAYLAAARRERRAGRDWPAARAVAFAGLGLGSLVIATMSWTGTYDGVLCYARAAQTVLLLLVAPLFLALGRPLTLALAVLPERPARALRAAVGSRAARIVTFPAITSLVLVGVPFALYFTPWYEACFRSTGIRELTYLALVAPGFVFFWTMLRVDPVPKSYPYLVTMWITAVEVIGDAALGIAVAGDSRLIAGGYYRALGRPWGPSLRLDQIFGGGTLWVLGDLVGLPFLAAQLIHMIREDEDEAAVVDAELDRRQAAPAAPGLPGAQRADRPWWESDPRFTDRFGRVPPPDQ
jgi:cytochrome c oxidase assembly factor CtaG